MATQVVEPEQQPSQQNCFTATELEQFERDGFVIARGLASSAQCDKMLAVTLDQLQSASGPVEYESDLQYPGAPPSREAGGGLTIRRLKQAHSRDFVFTEWISNPALVNRLQQLLGNHVVMPLAHHNCVMTKQPQYSSETGWHQDIRYWSFENPELVSVWLALGPETRENGCLQLIPGSHRMEFDRERYDAEQFFRTDLPENESLITNRVFAEIQPGDALFFHSKTLHAASNNQTERTKYSVVFTFRPAENLPIAGTRSASLPEILIS